MKWKQCLTFINYLSPLHRDKLSLIRVFPAQQALRPLGESGVIWGHIFPVLATWWVCWTVTKPLDFPEPLGRQDCVAPGACVPDPGRNHCVEFGLLPWWIQTQRLGGGRPEMDPESFWSWFPSCLSFSVSMSSSEGTCPPPLIWNSFMIIFVIQSESVFYHGNFNWTNVSPGKW